MTFGTPGDPDHVLRIGWARPSIPLGRPALTRIVFVLRYYSAAMARSFAVSVSSTVPSSFTATP